MVAFIFVLFSNQAVKGTQKANSLNWGLRDDSPLLPIAEPCPLRTESKRKSKRLKMA